MQPEPSSRPGAPLPRRARQTVTLTAVLLLGAATLGVQTVPELVLFHDRLLTNLLEVETRVELRPVDIATDDGLALRSWYHAPQPGKPVVVYFPGRRGDIVERPTHLLDLADQGYGLMLAGYRGYGGNPGQPSERRLYADASALLLRITANHLAPDGIVLYGYSMGTGIASHLAATEPSRGLILEAPFTSFVDVVHLNARQFPKWLLRTRFDTRARFSKIHVPILLLAGQEDRITPPAFAEQLATENAGFSSLHVFPEATHDTMMQHGAWETLVTFLDRLE